MFYILYKTTNLVNGKIYIGCHKSDVEVDDYLGSGKALKRAIEKYGRNNFVRENLATFAAAEDMFEAEAELVTEDFIAEHTNYNLKVGGEGGFDYINSNNLNTNGGLKLSWVRQLGREKQRWLFQNDDEYRKQYSNKRSAIAKRNPEFYGHMAGKKHSEETKRKIGEANSSQQKGNRNSQYGTCWIHDPNQRVCKKIPKETLDQYLNTGWVKGRKIKWT